MKKKILSQSSNLFFIVLLFSTVTTYSKEYNEKGYYPFDPIPFTNIEVKDAFWSERIKTNHDVTIPVSIHQSDITGRIENFSIAAGLAEDNHQSEYPIDDSYILLCLT